jgi:manganese/zinc/iron transport system permease protein
MGFRVGLIHYMLIAVVAGVTVASFEAVGSILVIAMLIVPAATAHLLTDRLANMIGLSVVVAILSAIFGYWGAVHWNTSVAGMMAVAAGGLFSLAVVFAPRQGLVSQTVRRLRLALRIGREDILALLFRAEESASTSALPDSWMNSLARFQLRRAGQIESVRGQWRLTPTGRNDALALVRSHRLWEAFLASHLDLPADHVHPAAEQMEHYIDPALQAQIAAELADPHRDPHGKPIPQPSTERGD